MKLKNKKSGKIVYGVTKKPDSTIATFTEDGTFNYSPNEIDECFELIDMKNRDEEEIFGVFFKS